ncbi:MAG: hypothetical protein AB8G99_00425 [Planctomycetaceae bacterium]
MTDTTTPHKSDRLISILLRADAALQFFALLAVFMPLAWMSSIHEWLGLGEFPTAPIAEYLARSLSAFYGLHGVITWTIGGDVPRYRPLIRVWAVSFIALGILTIVIDVIAELPLFWTLSEGPFVIAFGLLILSLARQR